MKQLLLGSLLLSIFLGCSSPTPLDIKKDKLVKTIEGKQVNEFQFPIIYKLYQDRKKRFYIWQDGKVVYRDLKFAQPLDENESIQVLDKNNQKKVLILKSDTKTYPRLLCGVGARNTMLSSKKTANGFDLTIKSEEALNIDRQLEFSGVIPNTKNSDALLFANLKNYYKFNSMDKVFRKIELPEHILIDKSNNRYKILGEMEFMSEKELYEFKPLKNPITYDNISNIDNLLLLQKDGLVGYYGVSDVKYKSLKPFDLYLARFELPNGDKGYIDIKGREYFD